MMRDILPDDEISEMSIGELRDYLGDLVARNIDLGPADMLELLYQVTWRLARLSYAKDI